MLLVQSRRSELPIARGDVVIEVEKLRGSRGVLKLGGSIV